MKKTLLAVLLPGALFLGLPLAAVSADEALRAAQQSLQDAGYYTGPVDGQPGAETREALRRYQMRNGLAVSGELTPETRAALKDEGNVGAASRKVDDKVDGDDATPPRSPPAPSPERSGGGSAPSQKAAPGASPRPPSRVSRTAPPPDWQPPALVATPRSRPRTPLPPPPGPQDPARFDTGTYDGIFARTPYLRSPRREQAEVIRRAQVFLSDREVFGGRIDGQPSPALSAALRDFQTRRALPVTGRLDLDTLAEMRLLPARRLPARPVERDEGDDDWRGD